MPGGGGLAEILMHGIGGGPGGGMGGMGGMMGGGQQQSGQSAQSEQEITDEYDVDRWARSDGLDAGTPTMVQQVRSDWERQKAEDAEKSRIRRFFGRFSRKKKKEEKKAAAEQPSRPPVNNTVTMPDMKKAQQHPAASTSLRHMPHPPAPARDACRMCDPNYLGLTFTSELDDFFTGDPLNSAILAVDSLSMSSLTLSQVVPPVQSTHHCRRMEHHAQMMRQAAQAPASAAGSDTPYMDELRESEERRKYNVRVT